MHYTREAAIERLLRSFSSCYNIQLVEDDQTPITARCDFFEHSGQYVISKKAELWSADNEEFLYVLSIPHLTLELYEQWRDHVQAEAMERIHVGPGHMASYITPIFICDTCDEAARKALKKCRIYKSFHFSWYGWMNVHTAAVICKESRVMTNRMGRGNAKFMKNILSSCKEKKEGKNT